MRAAARTATRSSGRILTTLVIAKGPTPGGQKPRFPVRRDEEARQRQRQRHPRSPSREDHKASSKEDPSTRIGGVPEKGASRQLPVRNPKRTLQASRPIQTGLKKKRNPAAAGNCRLPTHTPVQTPARTTWTQEPMTILAMFPPTKDSMATPRIATRQMEKCAHNQ